MNAIKVHSVSHHGHDVPDSSPSERRLRRRVMPSTRGPAGDWMATDGGFRFARGVGRPYAILDDGHTTTRARIVRVGTRTLELVAETHALEAWNDHPCQLSVDVAQLGAMSGVVHRLADRIFFVMDTPDPAEGARLLALAAHVAIEEPALTIPPSSEVITDANGIRSIVRGLVVNHAQSRIRADGQDWLLQPAALHAEHIEWTVLAKGGVPASPLVIEASGYSASYALPVLFVDEDGTRLRTTLPKRVERVRRRRMPRVAARATLTAGFVHPTYGFEIECPIVDVSEAGIGLQIDHDDLLCPGLELTRVAIVRDGCELMNVAADIRSVRAERGNAGLAIRPQDAASSRAWGRLVRELLHERTRSWDYSADDLWTLYQDAGYLNLSGKTPEDFAALKHSFTDATQRLALAPEVGYHVLWPSERGVDAAVTNVLVYSRAHLGYQMAKRPGKTVGGVVGKEMLRDIHWHTLEEALASSKSDWWIGYVQASTRFSNLLFVEFQARFRDAARECVVPFRPYQVDCATPGVLDDEDFATLDEVETICATIRATRPLPYWKSQDLTPEHMNLADLKDTWARVGLERERAVLVVREEGEVKAALIADLGHPGLHIYGLLDVTRFFPIAADGDRYLDRLLDKAKAWYASQGRTEFKHFHEGAAPLPDSPDRIDMGPASICIISMELIPDLLDYLFEQMSWDPQQHSLPPRALVPDAPSSLADLAAATQAS